MPLPDFNRLRTLFQRRREDRHERFFIVIAVLLAGWFPSALMLFFSYTILTNTLQSKILRDRQTFVQLIAHLVGDDLARTSGIIGYYQNQAAIEEIFYGPDKPGAALRWLEQIFYSHPRVDGMFVADAQGHVIAAIPNIDPANLPEFSAEGWRDGAIAAAAREEEPKVFVAPIRSRPSDHRLCAEIVGAVRSPDGVVAGFLGIQVLVERMGKRLSSVEFADQSVCQVLDQTGTPLFTKDFVPNTATVSDDERSLIEEIRRSGTGHLDRNGTLYSFGTIDKTSWMTVVEQPKAVAYKPVRDLLEKITIPAIWLAILTAVGAWLTGKFAQRQMEASRRIEREVLFSENILANMPSGIALVDPKSRNFLQANDAFATMARDFGELPPDKDIYDTTYDDVKIAPADAVERVLASGVPFQMIEQPLLDRRGATHFVNVNLLRLQGSEERVQGILYLVEDKTRDMTLRKELIGANAAKDQFLALLSHELRNPLSPVIAMVGELEQITPDSAEARRALEVIRRNVELEARLIDDLLDITRIAKGKLQLSREVVSVHEILKRAYEICSEDIAAQDLGIEFRLRAELEFVEADPARLQQVFWNLLKNSVKFTPKKGRVIIETFNPAPDKIEVRITDTGIGIGPEKIGKVFNAFEQGQSSITRRFGGLGLGLAISKAMVHAHGGRIAAESEGKDRGSTFVVALATVPAPVRADAANPKVEAGAGSMANLRERAPRLLVVDDHEDTCVGMKMMLERRGYRVTTANTADEAVVKAGQENFDLLISDIGLPDRSGYELMEELSASRGLRGIALSGFGMENDVKRARAAGFADHLTKPLNFERLEESIHGLLAADSGARSHGS